VKPRAEGLIKTHKNPYEAQTPGIQTVYYSLKEEDRPRVDLNAIEEISEYLEKVLPQKYSKYLTAKSYLPDHRVLMHQIPGGMISNLIAQLKELKAEDRLKEVYEEYIKEEP